MLNWSGWHFNNHCYALPIPKNFNKYSIVHLEMLNIAVALKVSANQWPNKNSHTKCDNMAVVQVLVSGRIKDATLGLCARKVWLISAIYGGGGWTATRSGKYTSVAILHEILAFKPNYSCQYFESLGCHQSLFYCLPSSQAQFQR